MRHLALVAVTALLLLAALPAAAETQLAGIRIGDSPLTLMQSTVYGPPDAMYTPGGVLNRLSAQAMAEMADPLPWALAVQADSLQPNQVEWVYRRSPAVGVVITGQGAEATVTNVIVSMWDKFAPTTAVRTERNISLGDSLSKVLREYRYPNMLSVLQETPVSGGRALPSVGGRPLAAAPGSLGLSLGTTRRAASQAPRQPGALPPATGGAVAHPGQFSPTAALSIGGATVGFTKHLALDYPGIEFTLYGMQVVRIHIYG